MNKLLFFLLIPLLGFGQNAQVFLKYYNQDTNEVVDEFSPIEEGQVLRTEVHLVVVGSGDYTDMADTKYLFLDLQYNKNILSPTSDGFAFPGIDAISDPGVIKERYDFPSTSFGAFEPNLLQAHADWQAGTTVYSENNAVWSVIRIAIQLSSKSFQDVLDASTLETSLPIFDFTSTVKPGANADPENADTRINLGVIQKLDGTNITSFFASNGNKQPYSVTEAVTYSTKLHFDLPNTLDPTNFKVIVGQSFDQETTEYTLDANADVIINEVVLDSTYNAYNLEPIDGSYIPDVHTVTDAYRAFKFLTDVGINGGDYQYNNFEGFSADTNLDGALNSADTYGILAYVMGVDVSGGSEDEPGYCLPTQNDDGTWYHGCTATVLITDYNEEVLGASVSLNQSEGGTGGGWSSGFTPTADGQEFTFGFWHHVDLDQSHSTAYPADFTVSSAKQAPGISLSAKAVGTVNFDMVSKIEGGQVIVELNHSGESIVGMQARIKYDTDRLILKDIVYDTGNTATNFSKPLNKGLLFGSLSVDGSINIKEGTPFKLVFDTVGTVNNTTGLFYFENTDAVKANGDKMNLNIQ